MYLEFRIIYLNCRLPKYDYLITSYVHLPSAYRKGKHRKAHRNETGFIGRHLFI